MSTVTKKKMDRFLMRESKRLHRDARRAVSRHRDRIPKPIRNQILEAAEQVGAARKQGDMEALRVRLAALDELAEVHLTFAKKSPTREYAESIIIAVGVALLLGLPEARVDREREHRINAQSARNGYGVLMMGMWALPFLLLAPEGEAMIVHAIAGLMGAAEIVRYVSRLALRGCGTGANRRALAA